MTRAVLLTIEAGLVDLLATVRAALAEAEPPAPAPEPPAPAPAPEPPPPAPAPEPPLPPPPAPPPPPVDSTVQSRALNMARLLLWAPWLESSRYQRYQKLALVRAGATTITLRSTDQAAGGALRPFARPSYVVLVDGQEHTTIAPPPGATSFAVSFDLVRLSEGWHWIDIRQDGDETPVPYAMYVQHGAAPVPQPWMPVVLGSHSIGSASRIHWSSLPAVYAPTQIPLPLREYPHDNAPVSRASIVQQNLVPWRNGDLYRPVDIGGGALVALSRQPYFWDHLIGPRPYLPSFDGPRGVGSVSMATHLQVGRTGGVYFTDSWRLGHISPRGVVRTLAGWRHKQPLKLDSMADDAMELVGDWSAVPVDRRGFRELWGMTWDTRTLEVGGNPIPNGDNGPEQPHIVGPTCFVSDSQHNRVCRIEFDARSHDTPARVTEFITGLADPWDVAFDAGVLYVSERQAHRIAAYDATTGAFIRTVVQGAALATVTTDRKMVRSVSFDLTRAQPCVAPEGLAVQDGRLYFASLAQAQIRKVNLATGEVTVVCNVQVDDNSKFVKIAIGDGTFGPRGMLAATTWSAMGLGRPLLYNADGSPISWLNINGGGAGPGILLESIGYGGAVGIGNGRMVFSSSSEGVLQVSRALASDTTISVSAWNAGRLEYWNAGYELTHGAGGFGFCGLPLPWGRSAALDAYLQAHGHQKGA